MRIAVVGLLVCGCTFAPNPANDIGPTFQFEESASGADEASGTVMIGVVLSDPLDHDASVDYAVSSGTAAADHDYNLPGTHALDFPAGTTRAALPVAILANNNE